MRFSFFPMVLLALLMARGGLTAEQPQAAAFDALGEEPVAKETKRGYQELFAGDIEEALASFNAAVSKHKHEHAALYALGIIAAAQNETQRGLELLCKAFSAAKHSPWAELYLEQLASLLPLCEDQQPFLKLVQEAAKDDSLRPHLKDLLLARQGEWLLRRGQFSAAAAACQQLQYLTHWALVGPLDNRDGAGFTTECEPEKLIDLKKSVAGRNRRVSWFEPGVQPLDGRMNLAEIFEPSTHVLAYAVTYVKAEKPDWAVLRAGCAGALAIWVNGERAGTVDTYNDFGPDKLAVPVYLREGWNQILVKSAVIEQTEWAFSVRLCRPEGGPYPGLTCECSCVPLAAVGLPVQNAPPTGSPTAASGTQFNSPPGPNNKSSIESAAIPAQPTEFDPGLCTLLEALLKQQPDNIFLLAAAGVMADAYKLGSKDDRIAPKRLAQAVALAPDCPLLRLALAEAANDSNEARQALETAWQTQGELPAVLTMLAGLALESNLRVSAEDYARLGVSKFGAEKAGLCALVLAKVLAGESGQQNGRQAEVFQVLRPFAEKHPYLPEAWQLLAGLEESRALRHTTLQKALAYCGGDGELRRLFAADLAASGQDEEAAEFMAEGMQARPFSVSAVLEAAAQYRRAGALARATELLESARRWAPENPELLNALGLAWHYAGRTPEAVALFREVLRLKPNSPQLKDYLSQLDTGGGLDRKFFEPYNIALADLPNPAAEAYPHDNMVTLLHQQVVRVNPNGSSSRMVHIVAKLLNDAGERELSQHQVYYEPQRQMVDILRAAVISPEGREVSQASVSDYSTSAALGVRTLIYDEHHLKHIQFRDLKPGARIDLQYTLRDTGDNIYGDYFADTFFLSGDQPTLKSQYVLDCPKNLSVQKRTFNTQAAAERIPAADPQREILQWTLCDSPGVLREEHMPPEVDQLAQLQVTTMKSWQEVGRWYWNLAKDQFAANEQMRQLAAELVKDCKTQTAKLQAIHAWVVRKVRYLGIEFGRNGYRPHQAAETCKALYGDCKDTATLLAALLPLAGIECRLVLLRTVNAGAVPAESLALPNLFNHCIAYVPEVDGKAYWLDGTAQFYRPGEIPWGDQGAQVLVVSGEDGAFMQIPSVSSSENLSEQTFTATVAKDGSGTLALRDVRHGQFAAEYRHLAETPGQCERYLKNYAAQRFNGAEILTGADGALNFKMAGPDEEGPMWLESQFKVPALAAQSGERKALPAALEPLNLSRNYTTETERKHDLELWYCSSRKRTLIFKLDEALKVVALPEEAEVSEPFGKYARKLTQQGATLTINEEFELPRRRILIGEYGKFRAFCHKIDSLLDQKVLLETK